MKTLLYYVLHFLINSSLSLSLSLSLSPCLQSMTLPDDLPIVVNFTKISLKPGLKYVRVASLSFFVNSSTPGGKSSGMIKIWGEDHTSFYHVQVPYEAHIMKGYVESLPLSPSLFIPTCTYKMYFILLQYFCHVMCTDVHALSHHCFIIIIIHNHIPFVITSYSDVTINRISMVVIFSSAGR